MIALLVAAAAAVPAGAQSMLPEEMPPAGSLPAKATSPSQPPAVEPPIVLRNVTILRGKTSVEVHLDASGPLKPAARVFSDPDRIVIDLADVGYGDSRRLPVNAGDVQDVRVAMFQFDPPVTRVVVDLAHPHEYRLLSARSMVILSIDTSAKPAAAAPAAAKVATVSTPSSAPPAAISADHPPASAPAPEAKPLSPPGAPALSPTPAAPADHPPVSTAASEAKPLPPVTTPEAPAQSLAIPAPTASAPPPEPKASSEQPPVAVIGVPSATAQVSPAEEEEETTPHQAAKGKKPGLVRNITVSHEKNAVEVHIVANKPLRASASTLSDPERIVVDLADVRWRHPQRIPVNLGDVQAVDISLYLVNPLVTRVVVSLGHAHSYHLQADGNSLTVKIDTDEIKAARHRCRKDWILPGTCAN